MPWKNRSEKEQRWCFVQEWLRRKTGLAALCRRWSISRKTAYKWLRRFQDEGRRGLGNRSHAAQQVHNRPAAIWLERLRRLRAQYRWGAPKLQAILRRRFGSRGLPSEAALSRWLKHWGLSRTRARPSRRGPVLARPKLTAARQPNEVWTIDYKGWFRTGDRTRIEPLTVRDLASRYVLAVVLMRRQSVEGCQQALTRLFRAHGLPAVIRVDNGSPFGSTGAWGLTRLSAGWVKLGIKVEHIAPGRPDQNGAHEQMHRIYKEETTRPPAPTLAQQQRRSERWRQRYNHVRPHESLDMRVPASVYRQSPRKLPKTRRPWTYPPTWDSRLVKGKGMISLHGKARYVGEAFEHERVGLKWNGRDLWDVYFGPLCLGQLRADECTGIHAVVYRQRARRFTAR